MTATQEFKRLHIINMHFPIEIFRRLNFQKRVNL